jgi:hypothetical protein
MKRDKKQQKVELYFYCTRYSWESIADSRMFVTSERQLETECTMLVSQRTAYLDFPDVPSDIAFTKHRVKELQKAVDNIQSATFIEVAQINERIQKLLCLEAEIPPHTEGN